jgi:NADH-quinone oxidoreductase subunit J
LPEIAQELKRILKKYPKILLELRESFDSFLIVLYFDWLDFKELSIFKSSSLFFMDIFIMVGANVLFYFFSIFLVISAAIVVFSQHPIFSLLFLVLSFLTSSFILFLLECEFLALLFVLVYVGAIAVLFLFAIMMLEFKLHNLAKTLTKYIPAGIFFGIFSFFPLFQQVSNQFRANFHSDSFYFNKYTNWLDLIDATTDVVVYGQILYSYFVLQFLFAGLILLVVLIGVVYLTNNWNNQKVTDQAIFKQLSRTFKLNKL